MLTLKIVFWSLLFIIFYTYAGYGILLFVLVRIKRLFRPKKKDEYNGVYEPDVTLFVTAYNERNVVEEKIRNSFELDYPPEKIHKVWVTDGSDDGTPEVLGEYPGVTVYHQPQRNGKIGAMNRGMQSPGHHLYRRRST